MKLLLILAVVVAAFSIAPAISRRGPTVRSLLQAANTNDTSYNYSLEIINATNLSTITGSTIFAPNNRDWELLSEIMYGAGFDSLLSAVQQDPALAQQAGAALGGYIVNGTHMKSEFSQPVTYTALAGNTLAVQINGTDYLLTFPNGTDRVDNASFPFVIVSFDNEWQGNIVHVIAAVNGTTIA